MAFFHGSLPSSHTHTYNSKLIENGFLTALQHTLTFTVSIHKHIHTYKHIYIHRKISLNILWFLIADHLVIAESKSKSFSGTSIEIRIRVSNDDTVSLLRSSVLTLFMQLNPLSASGLLTGKVITIWENFDSIGYRAMSVTYRQ